MALGGLSLWSRLFSIFACMRNFLNLLASGARSLSFTPTMELPEFEYKAYEPKIKLERARTPEEIMRAAWEDVGNRMWEAVGAVEREHGQQIAK
jgi:hypothetical protein